MPRFVFRACATGQLFFVLLLGHDLKNLNEIFFNSTTFDIDLKIDLKHRNRKRVIT